MFEKVADQTDNDDFSAKAVSKPKKAAPSKPKKSKEELKDELLRREEADRARKFKEQEEQK